MKRLPIPLIALTVVLTACQTTTPTTTATAPTTMPPTATSSTNTTTTTTTVPLAGSTTTTTTPTVTFTWLDVEGVEFPTNPQTVDELPSFMAAYLNAPMPRPDLTIHGPEDAERWVAEWLDWMAWLGANPDEGKDVVEVGWLLTGPQGQATRTGLQQQAESGTRSLGVPFYPISITGTFDELFDNRQILNLFIEVEDRVPAYTIDANGRIIDVRQLSDEQPTLRLVLRPNEEDQWLVEQIEVAG